MSEIVKDYSDDYPHLVRYRKLQDEFRKYREQFLEVLISEEQREFRDRFLDIFPKLVILAQKRMSIWCLNTTVTPTPVHCDLLSCPFKTEPTNVGAGMIQCRKFQLTELSNNYTTAIKIAPENTVEVAIQP